MNIEGQIQKYKEWQQQNPEWELLCDIEDTDALYIQWHELPKAERMSWIGSFRGDPKGAFEEFGIKKCKIPVMCLAPDLKLHDIMDWQPGFCMTVYKTDNQPTSPDAGMSASETVNHSRG